MRLCTLSSAAAAFSFFSASVSASPSPSRQDVSQAVAHPAQVDTRDVRTRETEKIKPKVFIVSMFDPEAEVWWGIPEFDLLANNVTVPGFSPLFPEAHCTADGEICQLVTGEGEINAAVTLTALWTSALFDLATTYFLIAGIAGISPAAGTLGSVTFARYAVQVALQYEFDAREPSLPANWSTGYVPQGATSPLAYPASLYGTEVFELNAALRDTALAFAQNANVSLADSAAAQTYRAHYATTTNTSTTYAPAAAPPAIVACDTATSDVYWSGALLGAAFAAYTRVLTNGSGTYCTTQQEDNASLEALVRGARAGALDVARVVVMRSASDFDRPYPGQGAVENLLDEERGRPSPRWLGTSDSDMARWLWLGQQTLERQEEPSQHGCFVVPRLHVDERLKLLSPVAGSPYLKFYAAAPITTNRGITIGNICFVDSAEHGEMSEPEHEFLLSMARKCMSQLESARECALRLRTARLSEGLASFTDRRSILAGILQDSPSFHSGERPRSPTAKRAAANIACSEFQKGEHKTSSLEQSDPGLGQVSGGVAQLQIRKHTGDEERTDGAIDGNTCDNIYRKVFQRASDLLLSSLEVEGVIFLDGITEFHGTSLPVGMPNQELQHEMRQTEPLPASRPYENARYEGKSKGSSPSALARKRSCEDTTGPTKRLFTSAEFQRRVYTQRPAEILGTSVDTSRAEVKQIEVADGIQGLHHVNEGLLQRFMEDHPEGKIWYFDREKRPYRFVRGDLTLDTSGDVSRLALCLPGVRQVLHSPLTDPVTGKNLAGCIAWTTSTFPVFTEASDLAPFKGFLHAVGTEICRIDTIAAKRQQDTFVASISHELRTPLHGILGTVDLLKETGLDSTQQGLADTISSSGSMLHATLGSVLSFAKINQFERKQNKSPQQGSDTSPWARVNKAALSKRDGDFHGLYASTNVAMLCEEVVDMTVDGCSHDKTLSDKSLAITLNIAYHENWNLITEAGALRRIMINLIGNAMKYTTQGFVKISLDAENMGDEHRTDWEGAPMKIAVFTVSDSGQGMSSEFVDKHLFVPFRQEDSIGSQGLGLGMSMVKSLVALLGGEIEVKSEQGKGSVIRVSLPMVVGEQVSDSSLPKEISLQQGILSLRSKRLNVAISGFVPSVTENIRDILSEWFCCGILSMEQEETVITDLVIVEDTQAESSGELSNRYPRHRLALLRVCKDSQSQIRSDILHKSDKSSISITQPLGPRKLTKALLLCSENQQGPQMMPKERNLGPSSGKVASTLQRDGSSGPITASVNPTTVAMGRRAVGVQRLQDHSQPSETPDSTSMTAICRKSARLLLVDDNEVNLKILRMFLLRNGYDNVETAKNGAIAVEAVRACISGFDIIFMGKIDPVD
ncbi:hypothetical protein SLS54_000879 [Diplodia seriata]